MFSDNQRQLWQNIKAPEGLFEKTAEALESVPAAPRRSFKRYAFPLIAASLILIFASVFFIGKSNDAFVYVDGVAITDKSTVFALEHLPAPMTRASVVNSNLTLTLEVNSETHIVVSDGYFEILSENGEIIFSGEEYTVYGDTEIVWYYPTVEAEHRLFLDGKTLNGAVKLVHSNEMAERTVTFVKN